MQTISKPPLNEGEIYIGLIGDANGEAYHLVLLPSENAPAPWQAQIDWAKSIGGDLPDRVEQAMLFKHFPQEFKKDWYWSNQTDSAAAGWAWCQNVYDGNQDDSRKGHELRARAVRRLPI